jgi:hypothetical protein
MRVRVGLYDHRFDPERSRTSTSNELPDILPPHTSQRRHAGFTFAQHVKAIA